MAGPLHYPIVLGDRRAASLDPLGMDGLLLAVQHMNAAADVAGLIGLLRRLVPSREFVAGLSLPGCVATMRDLGLLLGSIKRYGIEPTRAVLELDVRLLELGTRTGMVPRDTVFHYAGWNPAGARERTYTGHPMERTLISAVRMTLPRLAVAVEQCHHLVALDPTEREFAETVDELIPLIQSVREAIDLVAATVTAEFFAQTLRPYFDAVHVGGTEYLGPAAAHVPLYLVDLALWASDRGGESYDELWHSSARYGPPPWRQLGEQWTHGPSAATRVTEALARRGDAQPNPHLRASSQALCQALRILLVFRGRHLALARRAYDEEIRLYRLGSGGGSVQLLAEVTMLTRDIAYSVRRSAETTPVAGQGKRR